MWWVPPEYRGRFALSLLALLFGIYGVRELLEASHDESPLRDGLEALLFAAMLLALVGITTLILRRRSRR